MEVLLRGNRRIGTSSGAGSAFLLCAALTLGAAAQRPDTVPAPSPPLALRGIEESGRNFIGQPGFPPHLVTLFCTSRNPHAAADTPQDHVHWALNPLHSYVADGTGCLVIWAHPPPGDASSVGAIAAQILALKGLAGIELSHGGNSTPRERLWDRLLTACVDAGRPFLWGYAADDTHSHTNIGRSWLAMRLPVVDEFAIKRALRSGAFYTSNGPAIDDISIAGSTIRLRLPRASEVRWLKSGQFGTGPAVVGPKPGENHCLKRESDVTESRYALNAGDGTTDAKTGRFVRALILSPEGKIAQTMPFRIRSSGGLENPYPERGEWVRSMTHNHCDLRPTSDPAAFELYYQAYRDKGIRAAFETGYSYWEVAWAWPYPAGRTPAIQRVEPDRVPEGTAQPVTIYGSGFQRGSRVQFGARPARRVQFVDECTLRAVPPDISANRWDVVVTNPDRFRATLDGGLTVQSRRASNAGWQTFTPWNGGPPPAQTLHVAPAPGGVWLGTPQGLYRWDGSRWTEAPRAGAGGKGGLPSATVYTSATSPDGTTWFSTMDGIARRDPAGNWDSWRVPVDPAEIPSWPDRYAEIGFTPDGSVWIANRWSAGLVRFKDGQWERLTQKNGLPSNGIHTLHVDAAGRLWLADGQGLFRWENGKVAERLSVNEGLPGPFVTAVAEAKDAGEPRFGRKADSGGGRAPGMWLAATSMDARRGGVLYLGKEISRLYTPANSPLPSARVWDIHVDRRGDVWFATSDGVAVRRANGRWERFTPVNSGLAHPVVFSLTEAEDGALWFATARGVSRLGVPAGARRQNTMPPHELIVCGWDEVFILELPAKEPPRKTWSWRAAERTDLPEEYRGLFNSTDECKPIEQGRKVLITSSGGAFALVDRTRDRVLSYGRAANAHSADLLPGNRVAVAASHDREGKGDRLIVFDGTHPGRELCSEELPWGHGAVWDPERQLLWALADKDIRAYRLREWDTTHPKLERVAIIPLPEGGGHDLYPLGKTAHMTVTTSQHCWLFDRDARTLVPHAALSQHAGVKSISVHPDTGRVIYVQSEGEHWWAERLHFLNPEETLHHSGQHYYKARWNTSARQKHE
jgi:sugar lactone lactonase YvrE